MNVIFNKNKNNLSKTPLKIKKLLKRKRGSCGRRALSLEEKNILQEIKVLTNDFNLNNVTRTKAYLDFYHRRPEIHWSFLAHMVSRNAGWNMTDLKGSFLKTLLSEKQAVSFFHFLERGNWLIFNDAFPQLLIYEKSLLLGKNLVYLLRHLNISFFMETIWNQFWKEKDSFLLTIAQIINEQHHLEMGLLMNDDHKSAVFDTLEFKLQDILSLNHILFPYVKHDNTKIIGHTVHHFDSLHQRIIIGKKLYSILFENQELLRMVEKWANAHPHTGSRKDYWPHIFNDIDEGIPGNLVKLKLKDCQLLEGSTRIYSPQLAFAWKNIEHTSSVVSDWFKDLKIFDYFHDLIEPIHKEIESAYCDTLEKLELAANMNKAISNLF